MILVIIRLQVLTDAQQCWIASISSPSYSLKPRSERSPSRAARLLWPIVDYRHQLIEVESNITPDPAVDDLVRQDLAPYHEQLSMIVGETTTALNRGTTLGTTMDNFLLQALQVSTGAQLAFSNGWRYGAPIIPGKVTLNDLYNIIPMNPPISTVELTGEEIFEILEENLERTFARDPYGQDGRLRQTQPWSQRLH